MKWNVFWTIFDGIGFGGSLYCVFLAVFEWRWSLVNYANLFFAVAFFFWYISELKELKKAMKERKNK